MESINHLPRVVCVFVFVGVDIAAKALNDSEWDLTA